MHSNYTNILDPHTIITVFLFFSCMLYLFLGIYLYFLYSTLTVDIFYYFICFICSITKSILRLNNRGNIVRMLLIILLCHVKIHIFDF
jgi:hypothetical protein